MNTIHEPHNEMKWATETHTKRTNTGKGDEDLSRSTIFSSQIMVHSSLKSDFAKIKETAPL